MLLVCKAQYGWSIDNLRSSAELLDLSPALVASLRRGEGELVEYYVQKCNRLLVEKLLAEKDSVLEEMKLEEKIEYALW